MDIIFDIGKPITMSEAMPDMELIEGLDETEFNDK